MNNLYQSQRFQENAARILSLLGLAAFSAVVLYPFLVLLSGSLKSEAEFMVSPMGFPHSLAFQNYGYAWRAARIPLLTWNSIVVAGGTVLLTLLLSATAGFGFSRFNFRGSRMLFLSFILLLTIPVQIYIIPLYIITVKLRLADNYAGLILPYTAGSLPLAMFLFRSYFDSLPGELVDAARMDGCNDLQAFLLVILPLAKPIIATVTIFTFVQAWNEFFLALVFIHNPDLQTLPLGLQTFFVNEYQTQYPQLFATLIVSIVPIVAVYFVMQRQFVAGLTAGAVRG